MRRSSLGFFLMNQIRKLCFENHYADHENYEYDFFLQFEEQRDQVAVEQILRVVFLDPDRNSPVRLLHSSQIHFIVLKFYL